MHIKSSRTILLFCWLGLAPFSSSTYRHLSEPVRTATPEPLDAPPGNIIGSPETCTLLDMANFTADSSSAHWTLINGREGTIELSALSLDWPSENGQLIAVRRDGTPIWQGTSGTPSRITEGWLGAREGRTLEAGLSVPFELQFDCGAAGSSGYITAVKFSNGCPVVDMR